MYIRIVRPDDAEKYRKLRLEALRDSPEAYSSSYEEEAQKPLETFAGRLNGHPIYTFGAFEDEALIGIVTLIMETRIKLRHRANIVAMYVSPRSRQSGVGGKLMMEAIRKARETAGIERIYLSVTSSNEAAKRLYESLGFVTYGIDKRSSKVGQAYFSENLMVLDFAAEASDK